MAMHQRILNALAPLKCQCRVNELARVLQQVFLIRMRSPRVKVDDARAAVPCRCIRAACVAAVRGVYGNNARFVAVMRARENIDVVALRGEFARELAHIDIHAAGVLLAQPSDGRAMEAYQRDSHISFLMSESARVGHQAIA